MKDAMTYAHEAGFFSFNVVGWKIEFERLIASIRAEYEAPLKLAEEALNAMLTHMGMDEDEWTKPTFNQAREALAAIREALAEPVKQEPVAWCDHVEHRLLTWRQSFVNRSGDQLALDDFMDQRSLEDLIDFVCDEYTAPTPRKPEPVEQEPVAYALSHLMGLEFGSKYPMQETKEAAEQMARQHMGAVVVTPLYVAPVDAASIRSEALEEAAMLAYDLRFRSGWTAEAIAAAIRKLK